MTQSNPVPGLGDTTEDLIPQAEAGLSQVAAFRAMPDATPTSPYVWTQHGEGNNQKLLVKVWHNTTQSCGEYALNSSIWKDLIAKGIRRGLYNHFHDLSSNEIAQENSDGTQTAAIPFRDLASNVQGELGKLHFFQDYHLIEVSHEGLFRSSGIDIAVIRRLLSSGEITSRYWKATLEGESVVVTAEVSTPAEEFPENPMGSIFQSIGDIRKHVQYIKDHALGIYRKEQS